MVTHCTSPLSEQDTYDMWKMEDAMMLLMLRLIDYCNQNNGNSRQFLDGLLGLIAEEMEQCNFSPKDAPRRATVSERIKK